MKLPRTFIAVDIGEEIKQRLLKVQRRLEETGADLKFVEFENIHLTMKFLGDIPINRIDEVCEALKKVASAAKPYEILVKGIGVFPSPSYMRVIWAGVSEGGRETLAIHRQLDLELAKMKFPPDHKFVPHITIARVKSRRNREKLALLLPEFRDADFGSCRVEALELKESKLTPKGPIYSSLGSFILGTGEATGGF